MKTLFAEHLSDEIDSGKTIDKDQAERIFKFFKHSPIFRWSDANNDCEDRANAIGILLDEWKIPNYKGWVFSGYVFKKVGYLKNLWVYHVAASVPVKDNAGVTQYIIDPATTEKPVTIEEWAANVTDNPYSYYLIKQGEYYIFGSGKIDKDNWYKRNKRNYNWTMQGLAGINGVSSVGKAQLSFNKKRVVRTTRLFEELRRSKPNFLNNNS